MLCGLLQVSCRKSQFHYFRHCFEFFWVISTLTIWNLDDQERPGRPTSRLSAMSEKGPENVTRVHPEAHSTFRFP